MLLESLFPTYVLYMHIYILELNINETHHIYYQYIHIYDNI